MIGLLLRGAGVILAALFSSVFCFLVFVNAGFLLAPGFTLLGAEGYEASGPIGFLVGALLGLVGGSWLLFGRRGRRSKSSNLSVDAGRPQGGDPTETAVRTHRLALVSFAIGLIALFITFGALFASIRQLRIPAGTLVNSSASTEIGILPSWVGGLAGLAALGALLTGALALLEIRRKSGVYRGRLFAWAGLGFGAGWLLFRVGVALLFTGVGFRPSGTLSEPASHPPPQPPGLSEPAPTSNP